MNDRAYEIITNRNGRRILVINRVIDIEKDENIGFHDFDAVFLNIEYFSNYEVALVLQRISPFNSNKCWIKPRFYVAELDVHVKNLEYLLDGYAGSPIDNTITERIEEIYANINRLKIQMEDNLLNSHVILCLRLCKYVIVRGHLSFTTTVLPGLRKGYSALFSVLFDNLGVNKREDMMNFIEKLIELKYVRKKNFVERIHICPDCYTSHLLFIETCPKCQSSELREESVLHHFRCANISPESTYEYDGELRCPKCKQFLRHIGVDYDRPADIYTCQHCGETFLHSNMKVYCTVCRKNFKTSDLRPFDIVEYEFVPENIPSLVSPHTAVTFAQDIWNGYSEFELYLRQIRWFAVSDGDNNSIVVLRFKLTGGVLTDTEKFSLLQDIYVRFYYYNFTTNGVYYYLSHRCREEDVESSRAQMSNDVYANIAEFLKKYSKSISYTDKQEFIYHKKEDISLFIKKLKRISE